MVVPWGRTGLQGAQGDFLRTGNVLCLDLGGDYMGLGVCKTCSPHLDFELPVSRTMRNDFLLFCKLLSLVF